MKWNKVFCTFTAAAGLILAASCNNDYTGKENSHPLFAKGMSLKAGGQYVKACEAFESFLAVCPKSAKTHKELAELYGDYRNDYLQAVYHYEKYLDLSKLSDGDRKDIRKMIDRNKQKFYEKYQLENGITPTESASTDVASLEAQLSAARQKEQAIIAKYKELYAEKKKWEAELGKRRTTAASLPAVRVPAQSGKMPSSAVLPTDGIMHTVQPGETLSSLAVKYYGKKSGWMQIRDANPGKVKENGSVRVGQKLLIPAKKTEGK